MCDSEHMFDCDRSNSGTKHNVDVDELVRKFQVIHISGVQLLKMYIMGSLIQCVYYRRWKMNIKI